VRTRLMSVRRLSRELPLPTG